VGQHSLPRDGWAPFQEGYAEDVCRTFTKWSKRIVDWRSISYNLQKAFREAAAYPQGPVVIELPIDILGGVGDEKNQIGYLPKEQCADLGKAGGDPAMIEKAVRMLLKAERPIVVGGDGIFWSKASEELKEFVELLRIPVHTKRMGRGALPDNHPLAFRGGYKRAFFNHADVIAIFGLFMSNLEGFGAPPTYSMGAKYILVSESMAELDWRPKLVLRQMIECAKDLMKEPPQRTEWLDGMAKAKAGALQDQQKQADKVRKAKARPIDPNLIAQEVVEFLDDSATIILDSFFMAGFIADKLEAKFVGQILDSSTAGGVGHGVGMAIGAQLGRPGKQVCVLLGDGGIGVAGMDIETASRCNTPVVYLLFNNSGWLSPEMQKPDYHHTLALPIKDSWGMLPDIRYDKMFEEVGCHGEFVTEPEQIRPALERAFNSGKTSVINVIPDNAVFPPTVIRGVFADSGV
jgi:acetolactate synthase-1/2/3 large subunit